jgi:hypothetical protein
MFLFQLEDLKKASLDHIYWAEKINMIELIQATRTYRGIDHPESTLNSLFPVDCCIRISNLTLNYLLLVYSVQQDSLDLRNASQFFSRNTPRYKTTLCKLNQLCSILETIVMILRTANACEIQLHSDYIFEADQGFNFDPLPICRLMNRQRKSYNFIAKIRQEFQELSVFRI